MRAIRSAGIRNEVRVSSQLVELRRVSGTWHHEIRRSDGTLVVADRARGAFLDLDGRIRTAPQELLDDLSAASHQPEGVTSLDGIHRLLAYAIVAVTVAGIG